MNIISIINSHAAKYPDRPAHIYRDSTISYSDLLLESNRLANYLIDRFGSDKTPIIVFGHKQNEMLVCFLACVKAGHAYIPVDSSLPASRVEDIIAGAGTKLIFCMEPLPSWTDDCEVVEYSLVIEIINTYNSNPPDISYRVTEQDVYYIIYTSGSTGIPKGVQITLSNLHSFIKWAVPLAGIAGIIDPVILNATPFSFDLSVMDMYISLACGGTLFSIDKKMIANTKELFANLQKSGISVCVCTPSFADMCLADSRFNEELLPQLTCFLFCGETLTNRTAAELLARFPSVRVVNLYGPTEATVSVTAVEIDRQVCSLSSPLPVGKCKGDCEILIMNEDGVLLPDQKQGEIVIAGDSVSIGYYNNPENTAKAFFTYKGKRAYATGDEGYLKDGMLYYCGRLDLQIKLNGYRIEIKDVENNIRKVSGVSNVLVIPSYTDEKLTHLNAFVILDDKEADTSLTGVISFKRKLKRLLPDYMIPKKIIFKEQFPMNNNGKTDRKALANEVK